MAAHPKNKITRVEQGKRRKGNTPKLKKDTTMSRVPLHKRGFFQNMMEKLGVTPSTKSSKQKSETKETKTTKEDKKKAHVATPTMTATSAMTAQPAPRTSQPAPVKKVRSTQHKGG